MIAVRGEELRGIERCAKHGEMYKEVALYRTRALRSSMAGRLECLRSESQDLEIASKSKFARDRLCHGEINFSSPCKDL